MREFGRHVAAVLLGSVQSQVQRLRVDRFKGHLGKHVTLGLSLCPASVTLSVTLDSSLFFLVVCRHIDVATDRGCLRCVPSIALTVSTYPLIGTYWSFLAPQPLLTCLLITY